MTRVFLSYARIDADSAAAVARLLDGLDIEHVEDWKDVRWSDDLPAEACRHIAAAREVVFIVSPASLDTPWLAFEAGIAAGLGKKVIGLFHHPSLEPPGYLQNAFHALQLDELNAYFGRRAAQPSEPKDGLAGITPGPAANLSDALAVVALDLARLLLCVSTARSYGQHIERYPELFAVAQRHFEAFAHEWTDTDLTDPALFAKSTHLRQRLAWLLERLRNAPPSADLRAAYFEVFEKVHDDVIGVIAALRAATVSDLRRWIQRHLPEGKVDLPTELDDLISLRHRLQGAFLESGRIVTIWDDVDHQLALPFLLIDERIVPRCRAAAVTNGGP